MTGPVRPTGTLQPAQARPQPTPDPQQSQPDQQQLLMLLLALLMHAQNGAGMPGALPAMQVQPPQPGPSLPPSPLPAVRQ